MAWSSPEALLDSNVVIAAVAEGHQHHAPSAALFSANAAGRYAVAAHSHAEAYSQLTRRGSAAAFAHSSAKATAALESVASATTLVGLTPAQTLDAIRAYAAAGGVGPRLYDHLIGQVAVVHRFRRIVTWNASHLRSLFPALEVLTPEVVA